MSEGLVYIKRKKFKLTSPTMSTKMSGSNNKTSSNCQYMESRFVPVESTSTKAADAIPDDEYAEMDIERSQLTCKDSLDVESEVIKVVENEGATYNKLNNNQKAHVVLTIVLGYYGSFYTDYLNDGVKKFIKNTEKYNQFRKRIIESTSKFVLSIFDMDDLVRWYYVNELEKQFTLLLKDFMEIRSEGNLDPIISAIVDTKINLSKYPLLREQDVAYILEFYLAEFSIGCLSDSSSPHRHVDICYHGVPLEISKDDIKTVNDAVVDYSDLEDFKKNHLCKEFMSGKCSGLLTMLLAEVVREMNISEVLSCSPSHMECWFPFDFDCVPILTVGYIYDGLYSLALSRFRAMSECSFYATLPLVCGWVGKFSEEVVDVVRSADLLRRFDAHYYISVRHILLSVKERTAVDAVKQLVTEALSICSSEHAKLPPYDIYLSSSNLAKKLGAAKVSVEHLAIAAVRKGTDLCRKMSYDVSSEESAAKFLNENCKPQPECECSKESICCDYIDWDDVNGEAGRFCHNVHFFRTTTGLKSFLAHAERHNHEKWLWNNEESACGTAILGI